MLTLSKNFRSMDVETGSLNNSTTVNASTEESSDIVAAKKMKLAMAPPVTMSGSAPEVLLFIRKHELIIYARCDNTETSNAGAGLTEQINLNISDCIPNRPISDAGDLMISSANASSDFKFICCSDNQKNVYIFTLTSWTGQGSSWELFATLELKARPLSDIQFDKKLTFLIMTDKNGHVYTSSIQPYENNSIGEPQRILGHCSFITDTILSEDEKFILTSDRDHKIRMSSFPDSHNIERFFLAHTDPVAFIKFLRNDTILVSVAEKGNIIIWHWKPELNDWHQYPKIRFAQYGDPKVERVLIKTACAFIHPDDDAVHIAFQSEKSELGILLRLNLKEPWTEESKFNNQMFPASECHRLAIFQNYLLQYDIEKNTFVRKVELNPK